ncbi:hypothetical protein J2786_000119 [Chryseobacterium vietnamense]|uniref:Uncharacterized protein n=1 Tax=Chryseobacterium vietnamense TaxID=866785 RepID=A0ACC6J1W5_9FLAO|nr:hypothetical protein [Chryseobacterium vietnamense]
MFRFLRNDTIGMVIYPSACHSVGIQPSFPKNTILTHTSAENIPLHRTVAKIQRIFDGVVFNIHQKHPLTKKETVPGYDSLFSIILNLNYFYV